MTSILPPAATPASPLAESAHPAWAGSGRASTDWLLPVLLGWIAGSALQLQQPTLFAALIYGCFMLVAPVLAAFGAIKNALTVKLTRRPQSPASDPGQSSAPARPSAPTAAATAGSAAGPMPASAVKFHLFAIDTIAV